MDVLASPVVSSVVSEPAMAPLVQQAASPVLDPVVDVSLWGLLTGADWVVQAVMVVLLGASVWCWAIVIDKIRRLRVLERQADAFEDAFWSGGSMDRLYDQLGSFPAEPFAMVFSSAMREWRRSSPKAAGASIQQRVERVMQLTVERQLERLEKRVGFLASTGSTAPFVGLFGTVWGIMHSFQSITASRNTSLVVVAPAIAEALLATAVGLVAAIPAVVAYNALSSRIQRYGNRLHSFATEFGSILLRQMDEHHS